MRMCYAWLLKFSFFLHLLSLFVSHIIPLYPFFLFSILFLLFRFFRSSSSVPILSLSQWPCLQVLSKLLLCWASCSVSRSHGSQFRPPCFWSAYQLSPVRLFPQTQSLKAELEGFIYALPDNKSLFDAIPLDACRLFGFQGLKRQIPSPYHEMSTSWSAGFFPLQVPIATDLLHRWLILWQVTLYIFRHWSSRRLV